MTGIHGRCLKFASNSQPVYLVFVEPRQVRVFSKFDFSRVGPGAAGDKIEHRAFAGAVWSDDHPELSFIHVKVQFRNRFKTLEGLVHPLQHQNKLLVFPAHLVLAASGSALDGATCAIVNFVPNRERSARNCSGIPTIPLGRKTVTKTKSPPRISCQRSGNARVVQLFSAFTPIAPRIGPIKVPRPPTATQTTASSDFSGAISLGLIIPTWGTYKVPPTAAISAHKTKINSL